MTGPEEVGEALDAFALGARRLADEVRAKILPALHEIHDATRRIAERIEANAETRRRRALMAEFEASDPVGRLADMRTRHDAEARVLADRYGFPWPPPKPQVMTIGTVYVAPIDADPLDVGQWHEVGTLDGSVEFEFFTLDLD